MTTQTQTRPDLAEILCLEPVDENRFRARSHQANHLGGVFGGSLVAQALHAVELSAPGRAPHALHGQFHRAGAADTPIDYVVERTREGGSFSTRRVSGWQGDRLVFEALVSLQVPEVGFEHQQSWREPPPPPTSAPTLEERAEMWRDRFSPVEVDVMLRFSESIETRIINAEDFMLRKGEPRGRVWVRPRLAHGALETSGYATLAFISDYLMPAAASLPHWPSIYDPGLLALSLDQSVWFHAPAPSGAWLLYEVESPWAGGGRGLSFGRLYAEDGRLLATSAQEQVIRPRA